jgi:hypothetical protein
MKGMRVVGDELCSNAVFNNVQISGSSDTVLLVYVMLNTALLNCSFMTPMNASLVYTGTILLSFYIFWHHTIPRDLYLPEFNKLKNNIILQCSCS